VADLEPVHIGGVQVRHVSLHNPDEIRRLDVRVGDHVLVERAGDVIPHVVKVLTSKRNGTETAYRMPETCPSCSGAISRPAGEAIPRCTNPSCPAQIRQSLIHFGSASALDIDGIGEKLCEQLVDEGLVEDLADLFELGVEDLKGLDRMGEKSAENLVEAIDGARREATLARLIFALGLPHVGRALAEDLAAAFGSMDALAHASQQDLRERAGLGEADSSAVRAWFENERNRRLIERLKSRGLDPKAGKRGDRLEGLKIVITGELESMSRDQAMQAIRREGGRATSSVSEQTDFLVVGSDPGARKQADAREHGVKRIDERQFLEKLGRSR
jgi:DNA ligase (NAD+)